MRFNFGTSLWFELSWKVTFCFVFVLKKRREIQIPSIWLALGQTVNKNSSADSFQKVWIQKTSLKFFVIWNWSSSGTIDIFEKLMVRSNGINHRLERRRFRDRWESSGTFRENHIFILVRHWSELKSFHGIFLERRLKLRTSFEIENVIRNWERCPKLYCYRHWSELRSFHEKFLEFRLKLRTSFEIENVVRSCIVLAIEVNWNQFTKNF